MIALKSLQGPRLLTAAEVGGVLGLSRAAVYREIRRGNLEAYALCGRLRISPDAVDTWLGERVVPRREAGQAGQTIESRPASECGRLRPLLEADRRA